MTASPAKANGAAIDRTLQAHIPVQPIAVFRC